MILTNMIEPTDPEERAAAIRICRLNCHRHPETNLPMDMQVKAQAAEHDRMWNDAKNELPYAKWIWMWNNGRDEWDVTEASDSGVENG